LVKETADSSDVFPRAELIAASETRNKDIYVATYINSIISIAGDIIYRQEVRRRYGLRRGCNERASRGSLVG